MVRNQWAEYPPPSRKSRKREGEGLFLRFTLGVRVSHLVLTRTRSRSLASALCHPAPPLATVRLTIFSSNFATRAGLTANHL